ncbi:hypothetical protein ACWEIK_05735 [Streptomyces sp. NPDC004673]
MAPSGLYPKGPLGSLIRRAVPLIAEIRSGELRTEDCDAKIAELQELYPYCPRWLDLLFLESADLTDEQVMEKALEYRPFAL